MASNLTERLSRLVKTMRGQSRITETNVQDMLREVRMALLEADVALPVVRDFIARVKEKSLGQEVVSSLTPGQVLKMASSDMLLCNFRFDDTLLLDLLANHERDRGVGHLHAAILAAGRPVATMA